MIMAVLKKSKKKEKRKNPKQKKILKIKSPIIVKT